ncbi:hypothetical protein [Alicyclobacillus macrosporangiidus]|jgi:hypothetical protein|uniref:Phage major tail protein, phi13 family n=1 Tax=Alicyclobacillus macrosporangiidus TaxID=392015 RepID=A0A1I7FW48_9BACL|nr:hypothetical protein [Alicyclobacillus macrosporangiidus]SFU40425.1 hypothetical protein SAMN05421543_101482 [Alicyclobacillus macrosporangiidus]
MPGTQAKTGYLKGCRGLVITPLNLDGSMPTNPQRYGIKTSQEVSVDLETVDGDNGELRGGDRVLARFEDTDTVVGMNLQFTDARFDAQATQIIAGGTLIFDESDPTKIIGWVAPKVSEQGTRTPFAAEVYVANYNSSGGVDGFVCFKFPYCIGYVPTADFQDGDWGTPEFEMRARENPATGESYMSWQFVDQLPAELQ